MNFFENPSKNLFGKTTRPEKLSLQKPDYSVLGRSFEWKESVAFCFCLNCGLTLEINEQIAKKYTEELKIELPKDARNNFYFEVDNCHFCSDKEAGIKMKKNETRNAPE